MSIISTLVAKYINDNVTAVNAQSLVSGLLTTVANFVAGTPNVVDDAVFAEVEQDIDFNALAGTATVWVRNLFHVGPESLHATMFSPLPMHAEATRPHIFLSIIRGRLVTETAKAQGITRAAARAIVAAKTDDEILAASSKVGIPMTSIGDGTILNWLIANGPAILAFIMKLLPLLGLLGPAPKAAETSEK